MHPRTRAFSLIELLIVITILAILSTLFVLSYNSIRLQTRFNAQKNEIVRLVEEARSLSLSSIFVNDAEPTNYYLLTLSPSSVSIEAFGDTGSETIDSIPIESDMSLDTTLEVFYLPPYGDVCFVSETCPEPQSQSETVTLTSGTLTASFTIDGNGGYVTVE